MKHIVRTPVTDSDLQDLKIGDEIYLTGDIATCRDAGHHRTVVLGYPLPFSLQGRAVFHAGPIVEKTPLGNRVVAIGPTTSMRMERLTADFIRATGVKLIVGKGGMGAKTAAACRDLGAIHCLFPGGCAVLGASAVEEVVGVDWLDLGMPEAFWFLRVKELGPLIVSIDAAGNNLFELYKASYHERKKQVLSELANKLARIESINNST